ncbi:MAG: efflux RND transporter periplasmic adaptor subunit [Acidobacteriota bacterium]
MKQAVFSLLAVLATAGATMAADASPPAVVVTAPVVSGPVTETITLVGTTHPVVDSLIASEIQGRVLERRVENGDTVEKNAPLLLLDSSRLQRSLAQAEAEQTEIKARLAQARRQERRARDLYDKKVLPLYARDEAEAERQAQEGREAQVAARIASIKDDLARSTIRAPFHGVVTELHTEVGQWIQRSDPVVRLADFDTIEITLDVPERYFPHVVKGERVPIRFDALPAVRLDGTVFSLVPRARSAARTFPVQVRTRNTGHRIGSGMLARVVLTLSRGEDVLQVPLDAIVRQQQGDVVYLVHGDTVRLVPVRTGRANGNQVEVAGQLEAGDVVVVRGNERLTPGQKVRISGSSAQAASS